MSIHSGDTLRALGGYEVLELLLSYSFLENHIYQDLPIRTGKKLQFFLCPYW